MHKCTSHVRTLTLTQRTSWVLCVCMSVCITLFLLRCDAAPNTYKHSLSARDLRVFATSMALVMLISPPKAHTHTHTHLSTHAIQARTQIRLKYMLRVVVGIFPYRCVLRCTRMQRDGGGTTGDDDGSFSRRRRKVATTAMRCTAVALYARTHTHAYKRMGGRGRHGRNGTVQFDKHTHTPRRQSNFD